MTAAYVEFVKNRNKLQGRNTGRQTSSNHPPPTLPPYPIDTNVSQLIINDALISDDLASAILGGEIVETMDYAAGTLELQIEDASRTLTNGLLSEWVDATTPVTFTSRSGQRRHRVVPKEWNEIYCTFDGRDYALVGCVKNGDQFDLTLENRSIHELRRYKKPKVWYRDTYTRAMVFQSMCKEVNSYRIEFYAPELDVDQPIKATKGLPTPKEVQSKKKKGFAKGTRLTVKGHNASRQQIDHFATIMRVADSLHSSYIVQVSALITAIELSNMNPKSGTTEFGGGSGLFGFINSSSETADAHSFLTNAAKQHNDFPTLAAEDLAQLVVSGGRVDAPFRAQEFSRWIPEAQDALKKWGTSLTGGSVTFTEYNRYAFKRGLDGQNEDSWSCMVRLAKEVNWFVFVSGNVLYYVSDNDLIHSIPWDTIDETVDGIESIDYEIDTGKPLNTVTVTADIDRWGCPPGVPIMIENSGPANGRWLTYEVRRPLFSSIGEITCHLFTAPLPEPAPTTKRVSISGKKLGAPIALTGNSKIDACYARAVQISAKHYPYVYAGGHTSDFSPSGGGYDCSGYVSACLNAGGMLSSPEASGGLLSWGVAGQGKLMTVWTNPNPGSTGHVFIEFKLPPPAGHCQANTSHSSFDGNKWGAMVLPWGYNGAADAAGSPGNNFFPRHWPGT